MSGELHNVNEQRAGIDIEAVRTSGEQHVPSAAEVDAAARVMFEPPSTTPAEPEYTWAEMVAEDPSRADLWREDARAALIAAAEVRALPDQETVQAVRAAQAHLVTDGHNDAARALDAVLALFGQEDL